MGLFEGKTSTERNKIIAAGVLGVVALFALYFAFGRSLFGGSSTSTSVKVSTTPKPTPVPRGDTAMPTTTEQDFVYQTTPVVYVPGNSYAPDAGRNIFAFYEPPPPCLDCPTPTPKPTPIVTPTPAPTPPILVTSAVPNFVYAGQAGFRLDVTGQQFPIDARIYFNQTAVPTKYVDAQHLTTEIPANFIAQEGPKQIIIQTPDGKLYSNQMMMTVQAPPKPMVQYIGMIARKRYNNDTAYLIESGKGDKPAGYRLNDVVGGRFRLVDISAEQVVFEDTSLGFKHKIPLTRTPSGTAGGPGASPYGNQQGFPGMPMQRPIPPPGQKKDVDDNDDGPPE